MKTIVAIIALLILDLYALYQGIDGRALLGTSILIAGLGGFAVIRRVK